MDLNRYPLDLMLVPLSIFLTAGYHAYIWHSSKSKHTTTTIGVEMMRRRAWFQDIVQDNQKKGMLGVQSLRNSLMSAILSATVAIIINSSLAALGNNTYNSSHLLQHPAFGSRGGALLVLKYAISSLLLLFSFLCSSMAVGFIIEANFLINSPGDFMEHAHLMLKRGWVLDIVGSRALCVAVSFLLWMFGPVPLAVSSVALTWVFYCLDFSGNGSKEVLLCSDM